MPESDAPSPSLSAILARRLAHALRTPVGVADGVLSELGSSDIVTADPTLASFTVLGRRSLSQLLELARRLDWVARSERVATEAVMPVSWPEVLRRAALEHTQGRRERDRKRLTLVIADDVGEGRGHREPSERAVLELVDNALRHATTVIEVIADVEDQWLRVRVADDGPGLPEGGPGVFELPRGPGPRLGIGLWLVERLARAMQGSVNVDRTGPGGTVMCLRLPLTMAEPAVDGSIPD